MTGVAFRRASDVDDALLAAGSTPGAKFLGGGTNLVDLMKLGVESPSTLIDLTRAGLDHMASLPDGGHWIGAGVRNSALAVATAIRTGYPMLSEALLAGASPQLRNMATVGGNLLQRTRCRYFQDVDAPCNKREPGSGCPALAGEHHNLAILGASTHCIATHPSDMAVALIALDAEVELVGPGGRRRLPIDDLYRDPDDEPQRDTNLRAGELITAVVLPPPAAARSTYRKVRERASFAFAVAAVAAAIALDDRRRITAVRLSLGAVAHRPWRARVAEALLVGNPAEPARIAEAIDAELASARPLRDNAYKVPLVRNLVVATIAALTSSEERP